MTSAAPGAVEYRSKSTQLTEATLRGFDETTVTRSSEVLSGVLGLRLVMFRLPDMLVNGNSPYALLSNLDPRNPQWVLARLGLNNQVSSVRLADPQTVRQALGLARFGMAYALLNNLMGDDEPFPSVGCTALAHAWFPASPVLLEHFERILRDHPAEETILTEDVASEFARAAREFDPSKSRAGSLTKETLEQIGPDPPVSIVYRDSGLPGEDGVPLAIARVGGSTHTYVIMSIPLPRPAGFFRTPLCVVGDERCAPYFRDWP